MDIIDHGVCRLSVVAIRKEPSHVSEMTTQLLFGDEYEVLERSPDEGWLRIRIGFDHYEGWLQARQHHSVSREFFDHIGKAEFKITTDLTSSLLYNKVPLVILLGSIIPISGSELFRMEEQFAFNGESKNVGQKREFEFLKTMAQRYLNAPYQWGGKSPFGIDCSGFVQMVFKLSGYKLFRDAWQQSHQGKAVKSVTEAVPGDVAFFKNAEGKINHTGILLRDGKIIHASGRVKIDSLTEAGIEETDSRTITHSLSHLRRILP